MMITKTNKREPYHYSCIDPNIKMPIAFVAGFPGMPTENIPLFEGKRIVVVRGLSELRGMVKKFIGTPSELTTKQIYDGEMAMEYIKRNKKGLSKTELTFI